MGLWLPFWTLDYGQPHPLGEIMSVLQGFLRNLVAASRQYDEMQQSQRFIVFLALMMPGLMLIAFSPATHPFLFLGGVVYLVTMLAFRLLGMRLKI
jgi:hypothetical protein